MRTGHPHAKGHSIVAEYAINKGMRVSMTPSATPNVTKERMKKAKDIGLSRCGYYLESEPFCAYIPEATRKG